MKTKFILYSILILNSFSLPLSARSNDEPTEVFVTLTYCDADSPEKTFFDRFIIMTRQDSPVANIVLKTELNSSNAADETTLLSYLLPQVWDETNRTLKIQYKGQWFEFKPNVPLNFRIDGNSYHCRMIPDNLVG